MPRADARTYTISVGHLVLIAAEQWDTHEGYPTYGRELADMVPCSAGQATVSYAIRQLVKEEMLYEVSAPPSDRTDGPWTQRKWLRITPKGRIMVRALRNRLKELAEWAGAVPVEAK